MSAMDWIVIGLSGLVAIGLMIGLVVYLIIRFRRKQQSFKNRYIVFDNDQTLTKKEFEKVVKDFSHEYKKCGYVKNEFEIAINTRGYYTFMYGINSEVLNFSVDDICSELNSKGIKASVYSYHDYHKKYNKEDNKNFSFSYGTEVKKPSTSKSKKTKK